MESYLFVHTDNWILGSCQGEINLIEFCIFYLFWNTKQNSVQGFNSFLQKFTTRLCFIWQETKINFSDARLIFYFVIWWTKRSGSFRMQRMNFFVKWISSFGLDFHLFQTWVIHLSLISDVILCISPCWISFPCDCSYITHCHAFKSITHTKKRREKWWHWLCLLSS